MAEWRLALADLAGRWRMDRRIVHADGAEGTLAGTCDFEADGCGLRQVEDGVLRFAGREMTARRTYLWRPGLEVRFADGRAFHRVGPGRTPSARHLCGPDVYVVRYRFDGLASGRWEAVWEVRGPAKDYTITTVHSRPGL